MTSSTKILSRNEISHEDQWDLTALYPSTESWEKELDQIKNEETIFSSFLQYKGKLSESAATLKQALDQFFSISRNLEKLYTYAHLQHDQEITEEKEASNFQKITYLYHHFQRESAWLEPEILHISSATMQQYLLSDELKLYRFFLEKILRKAPHILDEKLEALLALSLPSLQTSSLSFNALNNADLKFEDVEDSEGIFHPLTHSLYSFYLKSSDRKLRKEAFTKTHQQYSHHQHTLLELLAGQLKAHHFEARARNFSSCLERALFPNQIPTKVYRSLIDSVRNHLPVLHRYISLRKKVLNVDELHLYDLYIPLVQDVDLSVSYAEAEELVIASVSPLGEEYKNALQKGLQQERWVDRYENRNKRSGAYSSGCFDSYPYILMNYRKTLRDLFTLAHEAGHSMHSLLSHKKQPYPYSSYPIFVAEVASTVNENLLMDFLLKKHKDPKSRLYLINEKLENLRATFFRQTMFAEFELAIHELVEQEIPLTASLLQKLYSKLNQEYFGPDCLIDAEIAIEWARIPHFYYNFYVYQYATGISAATILADKILKQERGAKENYLQFLGGGSSLFPIDLLKLAGVDLTTASPFEHTIKIFSDHISDLEILLQKS